MGREESLVVHDAQAISGSGLVRRLSVGTSVSGLEWSMLMKQSKLLWSTSIAYKWCPIESNRLVDSLCRLKHLRFLYLNATDICRLPDDIHNKMKFLRYIELLRCKKLPVFPAAL
jgi:hypothetical protein